MLICRRHPVPPPRLDSYHISGSRDRGPSSLNSRSGSGRRVRCAQSRDSNDDVHKNIKRFRSGSGSEIFDRLPDSGSNVYHQDCRQLVYNTHSWMIFSLDIHVYYPSGLHGDELDSPGSEDSDVYSQIDSLDRHPPVLLSSWIYARVIRNYHLDDEDSYVELLDWQLVGTVHTSCG